VAPRSTRLKQIWSDCRGIWPFQLFLAPPWPTPSPPPNDPSWDKGRGPANFLGESIRCAIAWPTPSRWGDRAPADCPERSERSSSVAADQLQGPAPWWFFSIPATPPGLHSEACCLSAITTQHSRHSLPRLGRERRNDAASHAASLTAPPVLPYPAVELGQRLAPRPFRGANAFCSSPARSPRESTARGWCDTCSGNPARRGRPCP